MSKSIAFREDGDSIVVQGDYAEEGDNGFIPGDDLGSYIDISTQALEMVQNCDS